MENFTLTHGADVITSAEIAERLQDACINHGLQGVEDLTECKSGKFENILHDVGHGLIRPSGILKLDNNPRGAYDINKLKVLLNYYIYLCIEYDKYISINGFYCLCGLNERYLNDDAPTLNGFTAYARKLIEDADARRIQQRATDSKQAILNIAYANYRHNWGGAIRSNEITATAKTLDDLKRERLQTSTDGGQNARFGLQDTNNGNI